MVLPNKFQLKGSAGTGGIRHATGNIRRRSPESGYVLLTLLLVVALLIVGMAAIVPSIAFQIRRDREEELIHRGVQYSRAIRAYFKKFGRYPTTLEDLESANNQRYLRKRYKDPISGQDFKLLHYGEVKMFGAPITGASPIAGANPAQPGPFGSANGPGLTSSPLGLGASSSQINSPPTNAGDPNAQAGANQAPGTDSSQAPGTSQAPSGDSKGSSGQPSGPTFGGGPIVGVVSTSKKEGIREFNHKKKYEEWQFIYDPSTDRGGLLSTPNQPPLQGALAGQGGQQPQQNQNNSPFSSQPGPGTYNNSNSNPPASNPPQQQ
jgi:type II secretory pathway pseudopilin PulG